MKHLEKLLRLGYKVEIVITKGRLYLVQVTRQSPNYYYKKESDMLLDAALQKVLKAVRS